MRQPHGGKISLPILAIDYERSPSSGGACVKGF
jgi:hypothetical protein